MLITSKPECYGRVDHEEFFSGWPVKPSYETVLKHFDATETLFIVNEESEVIGFISTFTDHALYAFIALLEVRESERGKGYGKQLVSEMLKCIKGIYAIDLVCDEELDSFYQPFGFTAWNAMIQRNPKALI